MAPTLPVYRMLNQLACPKAKVVRRLSPRITRELKRVSSLPDIYLKEIPLDVLKKKRKSIENKKGNVPCIQVITASWVAVKPS